MTGTTFRATEHLPLHAPDPLLERPQRPTPGPD